MLCCGYVTKKKIKIKINSGTWGLMETGFTVTLICANELQSLVVRGVNCEG